MEKDEGFLNALFRLIGEHPAISYQLAVLLILIFCFKWTFKFKK